MPGVAPQPTEGLKIWEIEIPFAVVFFMTMTLLRNIINFSSCSFEIVCYTFLLQVFFAAERC